LKNCIYLIAFFILSIFAHSEEMDVLPLNMDFTGTITSGNNIICYSNIGAYLISTDKGKSWQQHTIELGGEIKKIINYNDTLYGIFKNGIMFKSVDNGLSWIKNYYDLPGMDYFNSISVNDENIFVATNQSILKFDKDFNFLSSYTGSPLDSCTETFYNVGCFKNKVIVSSHCDTISRILTLDENLQFVNKYEIREKNKYYIIENFYNYDGKLVINFSGRLYFMNEDYSGLSNFITDSAGINISSANIINNKIYDCDSTSFMNWIAMDVLKEMALREYNIESGKFTNIGSPFINKYYVNNSFTISGINFSYFNLYEVLFRNSPVTVFEDSIIVIAGDCKSLLVSTNKGNTWELKSYIFGYPKQMVGDSCVYFGDGGKQSGLYLSTNMGATFTPPQFTDSSFMENFLNIPFIYFNNKGKGLICANSISDIVNNIAFSYDFGRTFNYRRSYGMNWIPIGNYSSEYPVTNVIEAGDYYYLAKNNNTKNGFYSYLFRIDSACDKVERMIRDTLNNNYLYLIADSPNHFYLFSKKMTIFTGDELKMEIRETQDSGKTWSVINSFGTELGKNLFYEHNRDSVFFTSLGDSKVFLYDRARNEFDTLLSLPGQTFTNLQVAYVNNKFYIMGDNIYLENTDRTDLTKWAPASWDYGSPSFYRVIFKNHLMFAEMSDSLRPRNNYRIEFQKPVRVEEPIVVKSLEWNIFPNPASDFITIKDYSEENSIEIVNILGIRQNCKMDGITINISKLQPGIYILLVKDKNNKLLDTYKFVKE
jgi:hypothetical protein